MQWVEVRQFLLEEATCDLEADGEIRPCLAAFRHDQPLFVAFLRSFGAGEYADPVVELLALAAPLGADRLALSMGGRAWSLDDPIPPVLAGVGDLRQRVVCLVVVDGAAGSTTLSSTVHPFTLDAGAVRFHRAVGTDEGEGWTVSALRLAVERRAALAASNDDIRRQALRCVALGHLVGFGAAVASSLGLDGHQVVG
jgi:hypothetical protein